MLTSKSATNTHKLNRAHARRCVATAGASQKRTAKAHAVASAQAAAASVASTLAASLAVAGPALAADGDAGSAVGSVVGVLALAAGAGVFFSAADPEKRREEMTAAAGGDEMASVKTYFETEGASRWKKIYGDDEEEVNKVQLDIRMGHAQTVDKIVNWLDSDGLDGRTVADCGCGTGLLSIPLSLKGANVSASDISGPLVEEARSRASAAGAKSVNFDVSDLESVDGKFNTVTCVDVMIHYPQNKVDAMIEHLASMSEEKLIVSFAPNTPYYSVLKRIGELAPGPSKATRAYLHKEEDVRAALKRAGFRVTRDEMTATNFYFSRLLEAERA